MEICIRQGERIMPYDLKIRDVETNETRQQRIKDLQEFRDILLEYQTKIIEVDLVKVKEKKK